MPAGNYRIEAEDPSRRLLTACYGDRPCAAAALVGIAAAVEDIDIHLDSPFSDRFAPPPPPDGSISGRVTRVGVGAADIEVCAEGFGLDRRCAMTGPDGRYTIAGLPTANYRVSFDGEAVCYRGSLGCETWLPVGVVSPLGRVGIDATL